MNWLTTVVRPKVRSLLRRQAPDTLWIKDPETGELAYQKDVEANLWVFPGSQHHMRITAAQRLSITLDPGSQEDVHVPEVTADPLRFRDTKRYIDRIKQARTLTGEPDAVKVACGTIEGIPVTVAVQDFQFMTGSAGMAAGEAIVSAVEAATSRCTPLILFACGGGMRMQEGILSLMQMSRTTVAVRRLRAAKLPYFVVLTDPTTGGITASYAMLGDVHIAEPGALIGFAGQRVIEQTIREKLPEGFQRAEYLREHGMVDMVVPRAEMRPTLASLCGLLTKRPLAKTG
ncbi:acetyl-CoA carboxylase, carboxyltransferase subunit beta [Bosea sp. NBC_00550]|uniref:acetyl-CoA carboxylase, carboxyltransferase subunit beta n=1 Tax=Bosea sp. NBC_00550 TaxID=2969621 RepID=UPI00223268A0|nr:acetyl-CoA carboxylase, carboxyltransferase subunit beta [Bosea sp. NBC_00550]UZF93179.1 acetyl-CoA carboxylase, carboxyltransferase subunit beta [Bosea sp. NBC_00550]